MTTIEKKSEDRWEARYSKYVAEPVVNYLKTKHPNETFFSRYEGGWSDAVHTGIFRKRRLWFPQRIARIGSFSCTYPYNIQGNHAFKCNTPFLSRSELETILKNETGKSLAEELK